MNDNLPAEIKQPASVPMVDGAFCPRDLDSLWRLANVMAKSGLMPKDIQTTEQVFVCVQMGFEIGLSPMQAVQNIAPINGRPTVWGDAQLALVRSSGLLEDFKEEFTGQWQNDDFTAVCSAKRKGQKTPIVSTFTIGDAKAAGLWNKTPSPWKTYPRRMLQMRARSWTLRDGFGDVLKGVQQAEEAMDTVEMVPAGNGTFEPVNHETRVDTAPFDQLADNYFKDNSTVPIMNAFVEFLEKTAKANGISVAQLKAEAGKDEKTFGSFLAGFKSFQETNQKQVQTPKAQEPAPKTPEQADYDQAMDFLVALRKDNPGAVQEACKRVLGAADREPKDSKQISEIIDVYDSIINDEA